MITYQAIEVAADGSLQATVRDLVPPAAGQVRIRVEACGICHTDALAVHPHAGAEPGRVPGHEVVGRIEALGDGVAGWSVGDRVGVGFLGGHCGVCGRCRDGAFVNCQDQPQTGVTVDGGYAEVLYARQSGLVSVPEGLAALDLAPLLCAGFTVYNALVKGAALPGDLVAVQGIEGLGHLGIQYARRMGYEVAAVARGTRKADLARQLGAHHYIDSASGDVAAELNTLGGASVIIATAAGGDMSALLGGLAYGGRLVTVGVADKPLAVPVETLIFGNAQVKGSLTGSPAQNEHNVRFARAQGIQALVEPVKLIEAAHAFDRMMSGDARFRMVLEAA